MPDIQSEIVLSELNMPIAEITKRHSWRVTQVSTSLWEEVDELSETGLERRGV